jgi:hypothetical protein
MPEWIAVRTPRSEERVVMAHAPFDPPTTHALVRAARSVRRDPKLAVDAARSSIYVVLLEFAAEDFGLYVGLTGLTPEQRFMNHKTGYKASRWVRRYGLGLLPALYRHLNPLSWEAATKAEVDLAEALRRTGMKVKQA